MRLTVVPGRSRIDLNARPALPGVRLVVDAVEGGLAWPEPGTEPAPAPAGGADAVLALRVRALTDADPPAVALPPWLAGGTATVEARVAGDGVTIDGDAVRAQVAVRAGGHVAVVTAAGRWRPVPGDGPGAAGMTAESPREPVEAVGTAVMDLRGLGFGLPPLVTYVVQVRWRLLLVVADPATAGPGDGEGGRRDRAGDGHQDGEGDGDAQVRSRSGPPAH